VNRSVTETVQPGTGASGRAESSDLIARSLADLDRARAPETAADRADLVARLEQVRGLTRLQLGDRRLGLGLAPSGRPSVSMT
jgi:hypothetical protein